MTQLTLVNHSSLLIKRSGYYIYTDPWHQSPAFGSWMPSFCQYIHPTYMGGLKERLFILISHGHDDHFDDHLLSTFDKNTKFIIADFKAPSVFNRLKRIGFNQILKIKPNSEKGQIIEGGFEIKSYVNESFSLDDAIFTIKSDEGLVVHANDNWVEMEDDLCESIKKDIAMTSSKKGYLFTQTNSASGYPLNYVQFSDEQKEILLINKVKKMIIAGYKNGTKLGLDKIFSYAGYATPYVHNYDYNNISLFPTSRFISDMFKNQIENKVKVEDFYPGDILELKSGATQKAFISSHDYEDTNIKDITQAYYQGYKLLPTDSLNIGQYEDATNKELKWFMQKLYEFSLHKLNDENAKKLFKDLPGKSFEIVFKDKDIKERIYFGGDNLIKKGFPNKKCIVNSKVMKAILLGELLFESLYTGYLGEWERMPAAVYNRDIVLIVVMFSYVYKNRLLIEYKKLFNS